MGRADYLKLGDANAICDTCGFKYKLSELTMDWRGLMLCEKCWEPRHPQEFLRGVPDKPSEGVENPRPDTPPVFTGNGYAVNTPSFPAPGSAVKNTTADTVDITISGGTITSVIVDGWPVQCLLGAYQVAPGSSIVINYSGSPSWVWATT